MEVLEKVAEIFRGKEVKAAADFDALIRAFDDESKPPKPAWVAEQLERLAKSTDELATALEYRRRRLAMQAKLGDVLRLERELAKVQDTYRAEMVAWVPIEKSHKSTVLQCEVDSTRLENAIADAKSMEEKLKATYTGPLTEELATVEAERAQLTLRIQSVENTRDDAQSNLRTQHVRTFLTDASKESYGAVVAGCDQQLTGLRKQVVALDNRQQEIEAEMRKP